MTAAKLRLGFAGTPEIAASILEDLVNHDMIPAFVLCQPDRPAGRGRKLYPGPVKQLGELHRIPVYQPATVDELQEICPLSSIDVLVVVAYGMILPASALSLPRLGCINVHMSLLPRWRGAAPIQRAIQAGDRTSGVSVMQMDAGLDTGAILGQKKCAIAADETAATLHDKLAILGAECLRDVLSQLASGETRPIAQDNNAASYAHKINNREAWIDWSKSAVELERMIRAFNPAPVARAEFRQHTFRIWQARAIEQPVNMPPGSVIQVNNEGVEIATGNGRLQILQIQPAGKRVMGIREFLNGHPGFFDNT